MLRQGTVLALAIVLLASVTGADATECATTGDPAAPVMTAGEEVTAGWTNDVPSIDGVIEAGEWAPATPLAVTGEVDYTAYLMNDSNRLYVAIDATGDPFLAIWESFALAFDNDHDGAWPETCGDEGVLLAIWSGGSTNVYFQAYTSSGPCLPVAALNIQAAFGSVADGHVQFEAVIFLNFGNLYGEPGATIGAQLIWVDTELGSGGIKYLLQDWPDTAYFGVAPPSEFGDLTYATCDGCLIGGDCFADGTIDPDNECRWCDIRVSRTGWSNHDDIACTDDGLFCTGVETCSGGDCLSSGDPCDIGEECIEATDECRAADDDTADDDIIDDDVVDDDIVDDDVVDDDIVDDDIVDDDTVDDDIVDDDTTDDDAVDDDTTDDDAVDDDTTDDDAVDDDTTDDDTVDDDIVDDDTSDDDTADDDTIDDDTIDDDSSDDDGDDLDDDPADDDAADDDAGQVSADAWSLHGGSCGW